jgi:hypothetical protein
MRSLTCLASLFLWTACATTEKVPVDASTFSDAAFRDLMVGQWYSQIPFHGHVDRSNDWVEPEFRADGSFTDRRVMRVIDPRTNQLVSRFNSEDGTWEVSNRMLIQRWTGRAIERVAPRTTTAQILRAGPDEINLRYAPFDSLVDLHRHP